MNSEDNQSFRAHPQPGDGPFDNDQYYACQRFNEKDTILDSKTSSMINTIQSRDQSKTIIDALMNEEDK